MTKRISVSLDSEVVCRLNSELDYGDSRSQFIEEAIVEKLDREDESKNPVQVTTSGD